MKMNMKVTLFFVVALFVFAHSASAQSTRLYVGNLSFNTSAETIRDEFSSVGKVTDVHVVMDRDTGKSRGIAFVTMGSAAEATKAIAEMNGKMLDGKRLRVNEVEERRPRDKPEPKQTEPPNETDEPEDEVKTITLYVGNLSLETTEDLLQEAFEEVGEVISVDIEKDKKGKPTGVAYIEMPAEDAENAISALHGSNLNRKKIVVKKRSGQ